jgi:hypothetical protein
MRILLGLLLITCCGIQAAIAQEATPQQLRRQLEELQKKLDGLANDPFESNRRVTEIGSASRPKPREEELPRLVTRIYDLSDLFAVAPSYPARQPNLLGADEGVFFRDPDFAGRAAAGGGGMMGGGGMGGGGFGGGMGGGGGVFSVPSNISNQGGPLYQFGESVGSSNGPRTSITDLQDVIKSTITPEEWRTGRATMGMIGASMVVTANENSQAQVNNLLDLFRQRWKSLRTVSMQGYWVWLTEPELAELLAAPQAGNDEPAVHGLVKPEVWERLLRNPGDDRPAGYQTAITCYNGQTVHTFSGEQRLLVTGAAPIFGTAENSNALAFEPILTAVHEGAVLQLTPLATRNARYIVFDLHSRVTLARALPASSRRPEQPAQHDPSLVISVIERPAVQTQRLSTTLRVPVEKTVLAGGMTFGSIPGMSLYFFVRGFVQELRDDEAGVASPQAPAPQAGAAQTPGRPAGVLSASRDRK